MLLTRDGAAKLADLGLAAVVSDSFDFQDISVGHFAYMAPELLLGLECTSKVGSMPAMPLDPSVRRNVSQSREWTGHRYGA